MMSTCGTVYGIKPTSKEDNMGDHLISGSERQRKDRPWSEYPIGTKAHAASGGHWVKIEAGWKWSSGSIFPTPGGDAISVTLPT